MTSLVIVALLLSAAFASAQTVNPDQLLRQAIEAQRRGDFQTAIRDYRSVLEARPEAVEAKVNLGAALAQVGQFDEAIAMYESALPRLREKHQVRMNIALAYYKKGDFQHANEQLTELYRTRPSDLRAAILLGDTDVKLSRFGDAVRILSPLEGANSTNLDLEYVLGAAMIGAGRRRDGAARIEKVASLTQRADAFELAGSTLLELNEYERARHDLEAALQIDPHLTGIYTRVGTARDKTGDTQGAAAAFRQALQIDPNDFEANVYLGAVLVKSRNLQEAKPYLERALRLNQSSALAGYEMALWHSASGDYQAAAEQLEKVVKEDPDWLEPHVELASLYYRLHRSDDGLRERKIVERITVQQQAPAAAQQ